MLFGIEVGVFRADLEGDRSCRDGTDVRGVRKDLLHALVGIEWLSLDDTNGGKEAQRRRIASLSRLFLDDLVQKFPERVVAGRDEVRWDSRGIDELHRRRIGRVRQLIDLQVFLHRFNAGLR